jgi:hypothetical protein
VGEGEAGRGNGAGRPPPAEAHFHSPHLFLSPARAIPAPPRTHTPAAMAGRSDDDNDDGGGARRVAARVDDPAVYVCGLEVGLLDVGRIVALNGYADACKRLAYVASAFYLERDLLMATKHVRYGGKQADAPDEPRAQGGRGARDLPAQGGGGGGGAGRGGLTPLHIASHRATSPSSACCSTGAPT